MPEVHASKMQLRKYSVLSGMDATLNQSPWTWMRKMRSGWLWLAAGVVAGGDVVGTVWEALREL